MIKLSCWIGYGPFSAKYGLGVDNILGAKVVNWKGEILDADERLLKGIRGAGGALGIIVELRIKLYPLNTVSHSTLLAARNTNLLSDSQWHLNIRFQ